MSVSLLYVSKHSKKTMNLHTHSKYSSVITTQLSLKIAVFWVVAPCSLVEVYQRFRGPCCLHHQGESLQPRRQQSSYSPPWEPQILLLPTLFVIIWMTIPLLLSAPLPISTLDTNTWCVHCRWVSLIENSLFSSWRIRSAIIFCNFW
jgi:hypothetical protein